ncbi:MAG: hypothetical protein U1C72_01060 [Candidatus Pacearchaeota archaeon]|nr:hypothetical protein [Candidatus Pacearchaeota archaeon]
MHFLLIIALVVAVIVGLNVGGISLPSLSLPTSQSTTTPTSQSSSPAPSEVHQAPAPFSLNTTITEGPNEGTVISEDKVSFTFTGSTVPEQSGSLRFETKVEGLEDDWKETSSTSRTVTIPGGPGEYTFLVRSKLQGYVDQTPAARTFHTNLSPYYGKVKLSSLSVKSQPFSLRLTTSLSSGETLDITGWTLTSKGGSFPIGQGIERLHPTQNMTLRNIILRPSNQVIISGVAGPFGQGINFRPNLCFGYLKPFYTFPISISSSCPDNPKLGDVQYLRSECQDFILGSGVSTSSCKVADYTQFPEIASDSECINFIRNRYTYDACYALHSNESGFDKSEWHVYEPRTFGGSSHDTIKLLDKQGLLVNQYVY